MNVGTQEVALTMTHDHETFDGPEIFYVWAGA